MCPRHLLAARTAQYYIGCDKVPPRGAFFSARGDYTSVEALTENCVLPGSVSPKGGVKRFRRSARQYVCASDGAYVEYVIPCVLAARCMAFERGVHDVDAHCRS